MTDNSMNSDAGPVEPSGDIETSVSDSASEPVAEIKPRSKVSGKVFVAIAVVMLLGIGGLLIQRSVSSPKTVKLTAHDMEVIFKELLPPQQQQQIASSPEEKRKLVGEIKKLLAIAQVAEQEGYAERPELASQLSIQQDRALNDVYRKKNPDVKISEDEVNAYYLAHPNEFDSFLLANPKLAQQAQGPQRDELKKQFGEFKLIADRARKDGLEREDLTRLQMLLTRSQALAGAYLGELQKGSDKLVTDADVEQYFNDHPSDFDEIRVRHILISTQPKPESEDAGDEQDSKDKSKKPAEPPKTLTKDEARAKAQGLLDRLRTGEDFAKLAKEHSDDTGSKDKGGEYDFFGHGRMVPEFEKAAFALTPGDLSDLVETQFGVHIIKLEERRSAQPPATDQKVRQLIVEKLKQEKFEARINEIAANSDVVVAEDFDTTPKVAGQPQTSSTTHGAQVGEPAKKS